MGHWDQLLEAASLVHRSQEASFGLRLYSGVVVDHAVFCEYLLVKGMIIILLFYFLQLSSDRSHWSIEDLC